MTGRFDILNKKWHLTTCLDPWRRRLRDKALCITRYTTATPAIKTSNTRKHFKLQPLLYSIQRDIVAIFAIHDLSFQGNHSKERLQLHGYPQIYTFQTRKSVNPATLIWNRGHFRKLIIASRLSWNLKFNVLKKCKTVLHNLKLT
jgi:hypothetical protein